MMVDTRLNNRANTPQYQSEQQAGTSTHGNPRSTSAPPSTPSNSAPELGWSALDSRVLQNAVQSEAFRRQEQILSGRAQPRGASTAQIAHSPSRSVMNAARRVMQGSASTAKGKHIALSSDEEASSGGEAGKPRRLSSEDEGDKTHEYPATKRIRTHEERAEVKSRIIEANLSRQNQAELASAVHESRRQEGIKLQILDLNDA